MKIITIFVRCGGQWGNLLLEIGPKADGTILEQQVHVLKELGAPGIKEMRKRSLTQLAD